MHLILIFLFQLLIGNSSSAHDIHVSKAEIHYKSDIGAFQISIHIYLDDLESDMEKLGFYNPKLCTAKEHIDADSMIITYLSEHFVFLDKDGPLDFTFIGREASEDLMAVWSYIEVPAANPYDIQLSNRILLDVHDDQRNLVSVKMDGERKGYHILDHDTNTILLFP